jgi:hypothetical protein
MSEPLNPSEVLEVVEALLDALLNSGHSPECCIEEKSEPRRICSCWRSGALETYRKYRLRARTASSVT